MRTTVTIADDLMKRLKEMAYRQGLPLRHVLEMVLRLGLRRMEEPPAGRRRYRCPTFSMGLPRAGSIDLDKALALAAALEDDETARTLELRK